jgi:hypothetical protein
MSNGWVIDKLGRDLEESIYGLIEVLYYNLLRGTEECSEKRQ